jgi:uncharacterized membrane protein
MSLYPIALFLHVLGTLALFAALALEWTALLEWRQFASAGLAVGLSNNGSRGLKAAPVLNLAATVLILPTGGYLAAKMDVWNQAWVLISLAVLVVLGILGAFSGRRLRTIQRAAPESQRSSDVLHQRLRDSLLLPSVQAKTLLALSVVFLMTSKPSFAGSLFATTLAFALALTLVLVSRKRYQAKDQPAGEV